MRTRSLGVVLEDRMARRRMSFLVEFGVGLDARLPLLWTRRQSTQVDRIGSHSFDPNHHGELAMAPNRSSPRASRSSMSTAAQSRRQNGRRSLLGDQTSVLLNSPVKEQPDEQDESVKTVLARRGSAGSGALREDKTVKAAGDEARR